MAVATNDPQMARLAALANAINNEPNVLPEDLMTGQTSGTTELIDPAQVERALTPPPSASEEDATTQEFRETLDGVDPRATADYSAMAKNPANIEPGLLSSFMLRAEQLGFAGELPRVSPEGPYVIHLTGTGNTPVTVNIHPLDLQVNPNTLSAGVLDNLARVQTILEDPSAQAITAVTVSNNTPVVGFTNSFGDLQLQENQITPHAYQAANKALVALQGIEGFGNEIGVGEDGFLYVALIKDGSYVRLLDPNKTKIAAGAEKLYQLGTVEKALTRSPEEFRAGVERTLNQNATSSATEK